jgi:hypothetical protein
MRYGDADPSIIASEGEASIIASEGDAIIASDGDAIMASDGEAIITSDADGEEPPAGWQAARAIATGRASAPNTRSARRGFPLMFRILVRETTGRGCRAAVTRL